jgi:hypothetical protein
MGIIELKPLIDNQIEHLAVKGKCRSRANLHHLMCEYFVSGKKFTLVTNQVIWVNFDPDIPKVPQCFNCLKIGHFSKSCEENPTCEICGDKGHLYENCPKPNDKPKCANCKQEHEATDNRCEILANARREKIKEQVFHITGQSLERPIGFGKNKKSYIEATKKSIEAQQIISNSNKWFQKQDEKVNNIEKETVELQKKIEQDVRDKYAKINQITERVEKAIKYAENTNNKIDETMKSIASELETKLRNETTRLDTRINNIIDDSNQNNERTINRIETLEKWAIKMSGDVNVLKNFKSNVSSTVSSQNASQKKINIVMPELNSL